MKSIMPLALVALGALLVTDALSVNSVTAESNGTVAGTGGAIRAMRSICPNDLDCDGVIDSLDNCKMVPNPMQEDVDGDHVGDACDNCLSIYNPGQEDADHNGIGDACEPCTGTDTDNDGINSDCDNCPTVANPSQVDSDGDGKGDACDNCPSVANPSQLNSDNDVFGDACDNCPTVDNADQSDVDHDNLGDLCDPCPFDSTNDRDGDGKCADVDNCPTVNNPLQEDTDANGGPDGVGNACDNCPNDYNPGQEDADHDGIGDVCDNCTDTDHDGFGDPGFPANTCATDNCPSVANPLQEDTDNNLVGDACQPGFTGTGMNVQVTLPGGVTLVFNNVTTPGTTTLTTQNSFPNPPAGFQVFPQSQPVYYDITTTASFTGLVEICFHYDSLAPPPVSLLHYDAASMTWPPVLPVTIDPLNHTICGNVSSFSFFAVAKPVTCACSCHADPHCDTQSDILDVIDVINVAFRAQPEQLDLNCPMSRENVDCVGAVDILDVVHMVNVAFRGGNPTTEFCNPCP